MDHDAYSDSYIEDILHSVKTIAMVGASAKRNRPSYFVLQYLLAKGFDVIPVNPGQAGKEICGAMTYASLEEIPRAIDMVDIFRNSEAALGVTMDALKLSPLPKTIWMQLTARNVEAAEMAEAQGVKVVMDRCPKIEYARLAREIGWAGVRSGIISSKKPKIRNSFQQYGLVERPNRK